MLAWAWVAHDALLLYILVSDGVLYDLHSVAAHFLNLVLTRLPCSSVAVAM